MKTQLRQAINNDGFGSSLVSPRDQIKTFRESQFFGISRMITIQLIFILPSSEHFHFIMAQGSWKGEAGGSG